MKIEKKIQKKKYFIKKVLYLFLIIVFLSLSLFLLIQLGLYAAEKTIDTDKKISFYASTFVVSTTLLFILVHLFCSEDELSHNEHITTYSFFTKSKYRKQKAKIFLDELHINLN